MNLSYLNQSHRDMYDYMVSLVKDQQPYSHIRAARRLMRSPASITHLFQSLRSKGFIATQIKRDGEQNLIKIILNDGQSTPWPPARIDVPGFKSDILRLREDYVAWLSKHEWSHIQVARASRVYNSTLTVGCLDAFARGGDMTYVRLAQLRSFLSKTPEPGKFDDWQERVAQEAVNRHHTERDQMIARAISTEREREERRRQLLERERAAFTPQRADNDDTVWMDAATVRALSGGTMGRAR